MIRLVLPTAPSPTSTHFTLRSGAEPQRLLLATSLLLNLRGGTGGTKDPDTGLYSPTPCGGIAAHRETDTVRLTLISPVHMRSCLAAVYDKISILTP